MPTEPELGHAESPHARLWRLLGARGVIAIAFGVVLLAWPEISVTTMSTLVGGFALASALVSGIAAFALPTEATEHRVWLLLDAIAGWAVGMAVLLWPDLSAQALLYAVAVWGIAVGGIQFGAAVLLPVRDARSALLWLSGVVLVVFGVVMFAAPGEGAIPLLALVAAFAIVGGLLDIGLAIELPRAADEPERRSAKPGRATPVTRG